MGVITGDANPLLGSEFAGVVREVGPKVTRVQVGDRVAGGRDNCFASTIAVSEAYCIKIPDSLDFHDAATMPCVYGTVIHSLIDIARLCSTKVSVLLPPSILCVC